MKTSRLQARRLEQLLTIAISDEKVFPEQNERLSFFYLILFLEN